MSDLTKFNTKTTDLRTLIKQKLGIPDSVCMLLDTSGSMEGDRIEQLMRLALDFPGVRKFKFDWTCSEVEDGQDLYADGGTNMGGAFDFVRKAGYDHTIIITDGQPDSEDAALLASEGMQVDVLYVGPEPAPKFLEKLARTRGGKYGKVDIVENLKLATSTIRGFLPAPKGPIQL